MSNNVGGAISETPKTLFWFPTDENTTTTTTFEKVWLFRLCGNYGMKAPLLSTVFFFQTRNRRGGDQFFPSNHNAPDNAAGGENMGHRVKPKWKRRFDNHCRVYCKLFSFKKKGNWTGDWRKDQSDWIQRFVKYLSIREIRCCACNGSHIWSPRWRIVCLRRKGFFLCRTPEEDEKEERG